MRSNIKLKTILGITFSQLKCRSGCVSLMCVIHTLHTWLASAGKTFVHYSGFIAILPAFEGTTFGTKLASKGLTQGDVLHSQCTASCFPLLFHIRIHCCNI